VKGLRQSIFTVSSPAIASETPDQAGDENDHPDFYYVRLIQRDEQQA